MTKPDTGDYERLKALIFIGESEAAPKTRDELIARLNHNRARELRNAVDSGVVRTVIIDCCSGACPACSAHAGRRIPIMDAIASPRLPHPQCTGNAKRGRWKNVCRCRYLFDDREPDAF